jgi:hypothetical protein
MASYLAGRAYATRRFYVEKLDDAPARWCMLPGIF